MTVLDGVDIQGDRRAGAVFSWSWVYRYALWRVWDESKPSIMFLMLNPSTATHEKLDPTVTRCRNYAEAWGWGGLYIGNLYGLRSTDPKVLKSHKDPVGPKTNEWLRRMAKKAEWIVAAWGAGQNAERVDRVCTLIHPEPLMCLKETKNGDPGHPLYLPKDAEPKLWTGDPRLKRRTLATNRRAQVQQGSADGADERDLHQLQRGDKEALHPTDDSVVRNNGASHGTAVAP